VTDRLTQLSERLARAADARSMSTSPVWAEAWQDLEQELLERLLRLGPTDDEARYRLQVAIEAARRVRGLIEHEGRTVQSLEKEMDLLEGRKAAPIA
jgi:hypothetical protein